VTAVTIADDSEHGVLKYGVPDYDLMAPKLIGSIESGSLWRPRQALFTKQHIELGLALPEKGGHRDVNQACINGTLRRSWPLRAGLKEV
jgi:hypothetical protein